MLFGFLLFACLISSNLVYIFQVADGFMEYMESICATSASMIIFVCFAAIARRKPTLFKSIENTEKFIETRNDLVPNSFDLFMISRLKTKIKRHLIFKGVSRQNRRHFS